MTASGEQRRQREARAPGVRFLCAVKAAVFCEGRFLIVQRSAASKNGAGRWELPGGAMEFGESPAEAIARELREETGLAFTPHGLLSTWTFFLGDSLQVVGTTTLGSCGDRDVQLSDEHEDFAWVTRQSVRDYDVFAGLLKDIAGWDGSDLRRRLDSGRRIETGMHLSS